MTEFFSMGEHGFYIWPCYILSFLFLSGLGYRRYMRVKKLRLLLSSKQQTLSILEK